MRTIYSIFLAFLISSNCIAKEKKVPSYDRFLEYTALKTEDPSTPKMHILYLLQSSEVQKGFELYQKYREEIGRHDFELLQQMALLLLEKGSRSHDPLTQLTSLFGCHLAQIAASIDILESGILSPHAETQVAAIQFLGHLQDDRCEELFTKAMSSDFFFTRLEAAHQLAIRKAHTATGQIESLMHKIPPQMRFFFAPLFALIGTQDAVMLLKGMMDDSFVQSRIEAILSSARFGRDDLLPLIRKRATHLNPSEQEACAYALGVLKDSKSVKLLTNLSRSSSSSTQLCALYSLHILGQHEAKESIQKLALEKDLFAIALLGDMTDSEETLHKLTADPDIQVRFNALVSLLKQKSPSVSHALAEFLVRDSRDWGFQPQFSSGKSLMSWKVISSAKQHQKESFYDLASLTLNVREYLIREALELPENTFFQIAKAVFASRQTDLVPLLVRSLEILGTPSAIDLLTEESQKAGAPLTRAYCNLALFRMQKKPEHKLAILQWIQSKKQTQLVHFRPPLPREVRFANQAGAFELTPEEHSRLLIECYETLALTHQEEGIDILLNDLKTGHAHNRPILAGLLIQAIQ